MLGETIGAYRITGKLSEGGMGIVYRAEHALLGRAAAVKVLLPTWSQDREVVQRFFNEARVTSSIRHPGIVEIFDFGYHDDGRAYLVMELLPGEPLSRRLARVGRLAERDALIVARSVAGALAAAHDRGVVHRDLKPDNVFLVPDPDVPLGERPKVLDFGIAKLADAHGQAGSTRTGVVMGTPAYMSPEQCRGTGIVDGRADLYSLGCILYELVAGRPPFVHAGSGELIAAHLCHAPDPVQLHAPQVSAALAALIGRLLDKDPARRPASALDAATELAAILSAAPDVPAGWRVVSFTPAATTAPTTLGGAAGAAMTATPATPPRRRRGAVIAAAAAAAVAAALALGWVGTRGSGAPPAGSPGAASEPPPAASEPPPSASAPPPTVRLPIVEPAPPPVTEAPAVTEPAPAVVGQAESAPPVSTPETATTAEPPIAPSSRRHKRTRDRKKRGTPGAGSSAVDGLVVDDLAPPVAPKGSR
jgi:eukaryotic-like serine/threonine-protein kinase